jgi:uncharacterized protein YutE (UPF0331/DUF86 family)
VRHLDRHRQPHHPPAGLEPPTSARDSFAKLAAAGVVDADLAERLYRLVGFRDIAVHRYEGLDFDIVKSVIDKSLDDLLELSALALRISFEG